MKRVIPSNPTLPSGLAVEVYWNLHKHVFSVRDRKTGLVVGHCDHVWLTDVTFKVHQAGRLRVIRENRKNVHAFVQGTIANIRPTVTSPVRYNPYEVGYFQQADGTRVNACPAAILDGRRILV